MSGAEQGWGEEGSPGPEKSSGDQGSGPSQPPLHSKPSGIYRLILAATALRLGRVTETEFHGASVTSPHSSPQSRGPRHVWTSACGSAVHKGILTPNPWTKTLISAMAQSEQQTNVQGSPDIPHPPPGPELLAQAQEQKVSLRGA